jgi:hypothetical protein
LIGFDKARRHACFGDQHDLQATTFGCTGIAAHTGLGLSVRRRDGKGLKRDQIIT